MQMTVGMFNPFGLYANAFRLQVTSITTNSQWWAIDQFPVGCMVA